MKKLFTLIPILLFSVFLISGVASAHVKVQPYEVAPDSFEKFTVRVPTEKDIPTTKVRVVISNSVDVSSFQPKTGWTYETKTNADGKITEVTWTADGKGLLPAQFDEFNVMAHVNKDAKTITWKAYQTYSDGSVVKWIGPEDSEYPASVTKVVASASTDDTNQETSANQWPLYLSIIALVIGVFALLFTLFRRK
ncbi:uncharacterized protein YcnI [Pullulanibacillus pueri]|uniref:YncI copper-binding domain-containing protein n=1 Tax=Pullulanibacillus pueri TaxID=1437324 RepID=A0A8J3EP39_9BACL|nr:YcnI family protein [Pullulanibacillus pueri]MBM7680523.1 uncharacterized protein YcnI [Pullulanibacillus pueri]GGH86109.1 hypothetical protein GCM10007096_33050 [Pullulanibacillus pueri]